MAEVGIFLSFVNLNAHFVLSFLISVYPTLLTEAGECWRGRVGVLQRPSLVPDAGADDAFGARQDGRKQPAHVPHPLGGAASRVHRRQERLH